ncbi:hypothetical protein FDECE_1181 [Fusarium decemcellulare]|nr:hypothetical protein FDECE_1181 [Fusarium decemcellulare]
MPYTYEPLTGDEIRLLTLDPIQGDDNTSPIGCSLEHVSLPPLAEVIHETGYKGEDHVWPEIYRPCDASPLFRGRLDPSGPPKNFPTAIPTTHETTDVPVEEDRHWRYTWGDYVALSYCWGPPEPRHIIKLNGHDFSVSSNLFNALQLLRRSQRVRQGFKLWIDAICINQDDITERSQQVLRMRDIYDLSWQVITYLGAESDGSELAMTAFRWMASRVERGENLDGFYREPTKIGFPMSGSMVVTWSSIMRGAVYKAIFYLLTRNYWRRMWILQEVAMAREDAPVACGDEYLSWRQVSDAAKFIELDEGRFDREVIKYAFPKEAQHGTFEFARGRLGEKGGWSAEGTWELLLDMLDLRTSQRQAPSSESSIDFLKLLLLARKANATDNKDKVYGILGIRMVAERLSLIPDYNLSISDIYQSFSEELVSKGDLNILRLVSRHRAKIRSRWNFGHSLVIEGKPVVNSLLSSVRKGLSKDPPEEDWVGDECSHELPSWAVCWSCKPAPTAHLRGKYRAGGGPSSPPPSISGSCLVVRGIILDTVSSLSSFHPEEADSTYPFNGSSTTTSAYGDLEATRAAFWRTVIGNTTADGTYPAPESYSVLIDRLLWKFGSSDVEANGFGLHEVTNRNKTLHLSGYSLEQLAFGEKKDSWFSSKGKEKNTKDHQHHLTPDQLAAMSWAMNALAWRRLVGTEGGRMGLACSGTLAGDSVALLLGCDVPMVLRRRGEGGWTVVGECCLHGVMDGEALETKTEDIGEIVLH